MCSAPSSDLATQNIRVIHLAAIAIAMNTGESGRARARAKKSPMTYVASHYLKMML